MGYREDMGLTIPDWPGWRLVEWFSEPMLPGDNFNNIGASPERSPNQVSSSKGITPAQAWGDSRANRYCVYRRVNPWVELGGDETLRGGDIITNEGGLPPVGEVGTHGKFKDGYFWCHPVGYGCGDYTLNKIKRSYNTDAAKAWRRLGPPVVEAKRRLPPNPPQLTKPLPLP